MKKIIKLTESDLTRIVKRVIQENKKEDMSFDFSQFDYDSLGNFFTEKKNFNYITNNDGLDIYILKNDGYDIMVGTKPTYTKTDILFLVYIIFKSGQKINYLEEVYGKSGITLSIDDITKMSNLIEGVIEFGDSQL
jgi:hypothetical protein